MTEFLDIFKKRKTIIKKEIPKPKIIIDYREKNSLVVSSLIKLGFQPEIKELKVADYIFNNIAIERKTVSDLYSSIIDKRIFNQIEELKQYQNRLIIIEGLENKELYNDHQKQGINANAIRGILLSITLKHKTPVIFTKNSFDTAKFIEVLSKKKQTEPSLNVTKKNLTKKEQMQFILESFQGIGPKNARKLLVEFETLKNIFNAKPEELQKILGKKSEIFDLLEIKY
ncbi:MAG: helix-hairpin-helix domain-containing protein [Candidatus Pacearchaeota archaeon]|nr:helix-hairpin-helix domain-containing protein [Candidatus Pacearchaeota archaeon]